MDKRIVITGNIGTGKSTVTKILEETGYKVISADIISAEILKDNQQTVSEMFGIRPLEFSSFKKELSNIVFSNTDSRKYLEDFMLPKINEKIDKISSDYKVNGDLFIVEMPTFYESRGLEKHGEFFVINIIADKALRVQRIMERNKQLSIQDTLDRMKTQLSPESKIGFSDVTIENNEGYSELKEKVIALEKYLSGGSL